MQDLSEGNFELGGLPAESFARRSPPDYQAQQEDRGAIC